MWKSLKNATTSKSVDYSSSSISAPLDAPTPAPASASHQHLNPHDNSVGGSAPPKKASSMSFSGIASGLTGGNRSRSASPAIDRSASFNNNQPVADRHREAMGVFASEPVSVPSPPKPPKPQFVMRTQNELNELQSEPDRAFTDEALPASSSSVHSAGSTGAYLNARTNSTRVPEPRQGGYPPLPGETQAPTQQPSEASSGPTAGSSSSTPDKRQSNSVS